METNTLPKPIVLTEARPGTSEWLLAHEGKIGSNDLAVLMGIPRFGRTRLRLWGELTGKLEREDISDKPEVRRGVLLEPVVKYLFEKDRSRTVLACPGLVQHPTLPFIACTPDGIVDDGNPIELKTVGQWARKDWEADVPLGTLIQGNGHAWVWGSDSAWWAAFCLDAKAASEAMGLEPVLEEGEEEEEDFKSPPPKGDPLLLWAQRARRNDLLEQLGNEAVDFYENHVRKDIPPEPGADIKAVKAIWKREVPEKIATLTAELELAWFENANIAKMRTAGKKRQDELKAKILVALGDAEYGVTPGNVVLRARSYEVAERIAAGYSARPLIKVKAVGA